MFGDRQSILLYQRDPYVALLRAVSGRVDELQRDELFADTPLRNITIESCTTVTGQPGARPVAEGVMYSAVQAPFGLGTDRSGRLAPLHLFEGIGHLLVTGSEAIGAVRLGDCIGDSPFRAAAESPDDVAVVALDLSKLSIANLVRTKKVLRGGYKERSINLMFATGGININRPVNDFSSMAEITLGTLFDALVGAAARAQLGLDLTDVERSQVEQIGRGDLRTVHPDGGVEILFPERET